MRHNIFILIIFVLSIVIASCTIDETTNTPTTTATPKPRKSTSKDHHINKRMCPDCQEWNCIYEEINEVTKGSTDNELMDAIIKVVNRRKIIDQNKVDMIVKEYYL